MWHIVLVPQLMSGDWFWFCLKYSNRFKDTRHGCCGCPPKQSSSSREKLGQAYHQYGEETRLQGCAVHQATGDGIESPLLLKFYSQPHLFGSRMQGNRTLALNEWLRPETGSCMQCRVRKSLAVVTRGKPCNHTTDFTLVTNTRITLRSAGAHVHRPGRLTPVADLVVEMMTAFFAWLTDISGRRRS